MRVSPVEVGSIALPCPATVVTSAVPATVGRTCNQVNNLSPNEWITERTEDTNVEREDEEEETRARAP